MESVGGIVGRRFSVRGRRFVCSVFIGIVRSIFRREWIVDGYIFIYIVIYYELFYL